MAIFKQPRVPEYHDGKGVGRFLHDLVRFLKDFCNDVWTAQRQNTQDIEDICRRLDTLDGGEG